MTNEPQPMTNEEFDARVRADLKAAALRSARQCREAAERRQEADSAPELPPVDEPVPSVPQAEPGPRTEDRAPHGWWVRPVWVVAAAVVLAVGLGVGYWLGSRPNAPEVVRPEPGGAARLKSCEFAVLRPGPNGWVREGYLGETPVALHAGDHIVVSARADGLAHWAVVARRPDGTVVTLLPVQEDTQAAESVAVRYPVDSDGEWLFAAVVTPDAAACRATLAAAADTREVLGTAHALAYTNGAPHVIGVPRDDNLPAATRAARERFDQLCRRLAGTHGSVRAVLTPAPRP